MCQGKHCSNKDPQAKFKYKDLYDNVFTFILTFTEEIIVNIEEILEVSLEDHENIETEIETI